MAEHEVPHRHVGVHEKKLTPGEVDRVTFRGAAPGDQRPGWANAIKQLEVISDGAADIYITLGVDTEPEVRGTMCWRIPGYAGSTVLPVPKAALADNGELQVNLISEGAPVYSVGRS